MARLPAPLRRPAFRTVWLAGLISEAGDWLLFIALPIVVFRLTGSALGTAAAFLAQLVPAVVVAPVGGRLADRLDRRWTMVAVSAAQAATLLALLTVHDRHGLGVVFGVIAVQAALAAVFEPAKNALAPSLVSRDELVAANSLIGLNDGLARLVGGPLGGLLLAAGDLHAIVIADAVTYLLAGTLIARAPTGAASAPTSHRRNGSGPGPDDGPRGPVVRAGLAVAFVADVAQGIFVVLFLVFVARRLHGGAGEIGLLRGVQAVGAIAAGLLLALSSRRAVPATLAAAGAFAFGAISLLVWNLPAVTTAGAVYVVLFALVGGPGVIMVAGLVSALQHAVPDAERGRVFGALTVAESAGQGVGMMVAGLLTSTLGLATVLDAQGGLYLLAGAIAATTLSRHAADRLGPRG